MSAHMLLRFCGMNLVRARTSRSWLTASPVIASSSCVMSWLISAPSLARLHTVLDSPYVLWICKVMIMFQDRGYVAKSRLFASALPCQSACTCVTALWYKDLQMHRPPFRSPGAAQPCCHYDSG